MTALYRHNVKKCQHGMTVKDMLFIRNWTSWTVCKSGNDWSSTLSHPCTQPPVRFRRKSS